MKNLEVYLHLVVALRESRRSPRWKPEDDRPILARLEDLYATLSDTDQDRVEAEGWRAWPEEYDARMLRDLEEVPLDAADNGGASQMPRQSKAA
jgi:hypothetical protein